MTEYRETQLYCVTDEEGRVLLVATFMQCLRFRRKGQDLKIKHYK